MATPGGLVDKQELIDAQLDTAHLGRVVNSKDASGAPIDTSTNRTGGVNKTLNALEAEYQGEIDSLEARSDAAIAEADDKFDVQRDEFDATFRAQFAYKRIGNISDYVGQSLPEVDKLNSYQYPDDSGEWYGPVQSQSFPVTIPADPSTDNGWALVNAINTESLGNLTNYQASSVPDMISGSTLSGSVSLGLGQYWFVGDTLYECNTSITPAPNGVDDFKLVNAASCSSFGAVDISQSPNHDSNQSILDALNYLNGKGGGTLIIDGQFNATRLPIFSNITLLARYSDSALLCIDNSSTDPNVSFGSFFKKPDDGNRVTGFKIENGLYLGTALSGVSAAEDNNQNVIGLNLCGCERSSIDVRLGGFGYGGYVLARAEGGAEGLGFVNTTQDGNYNEIKVRSIAYCGFYNPNRAAEWFKYKANSNTIPFSFAKGLKGLHFAFPNANNNTVLSSTTESSESVASFGSLGVGNEIINPRAEVLSGDAFTFNSASLGNFILGGRYTGVAGEVASGYQGTQNTIIADSLIYYPTLADYPPTTNISTTHNRFIQSMQGVFGKVGLPHFVKSDVYNDASSYPQHGLLNTVSNALVGDILGEYVFYNMDASAGARGISASLRAFMSGGAGQTSLGFCTGTGSNLEIQWEVNDAGDLSPSFDAVKDIGKDASHRVNDMRIVNPPITGSSYKIKDDLGSIPQDLLDFVMSVEMRKWKHKDGERGHFGIIITEDFLTEIKRITDIDKFGPLCLDVFTDENGKPVTKTIHTVELGELWQVRQDEWQNLMLEAMRRKIIAM